jgi:hypothetical protein
MPGKVTVLDRQLRANDTLRSQSAFSKGSLMNSTDGGAMNSTKKIERDR